MKVAVTVQGKDLEALVDPRFGRAAGMLIVDTESGALEYLDNASGMRAAQGAGIEAARRVAERGAQALLTGHCGPNAYRALQAAGIKVYTGLARGNVREAIDRYKTGALEEATGADVQGQW